MNKPFKITFDPALTQTLFKKLIERLTTSFRLRPLMFYSPTKIYAYIPSKSVAFVLITKRSIFMNTSPSIFRKVKKVVSSVLRYQPKRR